MHNDCKLLASQNNAASPRCGTTWSATLARTCLPIATHRTHDGCLANWRALICRHAGVKYHLRQGLPAARSALLRLSGIAINKLAAAIKTPAVQTHRCGYW